MILIKLIYDHYLQINLFIHLFLNCLRYLFLSSLVLLMLSETCMEYLSCIEL